MAAPPGCVRILGQDIHAISQLERTRLRQKTGVAFQGGALFSSMSVLDNIMLPLREHTKLDIHTMRIMARLKDGVDRANAVVSVCSSRDRLNSNRA